jgi:hypothetical protein
VKAQGMALQIEYAGTVDGDAMKGAVKLGEMGEGRFTGGSKPINVVSLS